jgi:hypothetical protein
VRRLAISVVVVAALAALPARGAFGDDHAGAVELVVIVQVDNHAAMSASDLEAYFLRKERHWPAGDVVVPFNFPPETAPRRTFDRAALGMSPDEVARYWLDQRIRDGGTAPREVGDATLIVKLVARLPGAIGYVPAGTAMAGVRVVARVKGGELVAP